ncbi:MAG: beta-lactamase family protein [Bacteroidales bacterium]|nr:beta-lactamase family protein [Bacteroidales bacterium]
MEKQFNNVTRSKKIHEAVLFVENTKGDFSVSYGYGGKDKHTPFFIASVSKLFVTSCILILREQKKLSLNDLIINYIDKTTLDNLHIYKGEDYSHRLTISDLLFHKSGLPDGLIDSDILKHFIQADIDVSFDMALEKTKALSPHFAPDTKNKAYYSDINFRLLVKIIENVTKTPLAQVYQNYICIPVGMTNTYLPTNSEDFIPTIYYNNETLYRPKFFNSDYNYDAISTANDLMLFLKAFWNGALFSQTVFEQLSAYRKLQMSMGPIYYGGGYMQIPMKSILTLFMGKGELIGHSGISGSFAFYYPEKDLFFVGDLNQMAKPELPIRLLIKLAMSVKNFTKNIVRITRV